VKEAPPPGCAIQTAAAKTCLPRLESCFSDGASSAVALWSIGGGEVMMRRPYMIGADGLLCLVCFRHAYRPPSLSGASLVNAALPGAHLPGVDFRAVNLSCSDLGNADLSGARLQSANLSRANLGTANLARADLRDADLRGANMMGANLGGALLAGALYDKHTTWPDHVSPQAAGAILQATPERRASSLRHYGRRDMAF
jgi:uncharacterized protein YjbI with pentapeptide repeats